MLLVANLLLCKNMSLWCKAVSYLCDGFAVSDGIVRHAPYSNSFGQLCATRLQRQEKQAMEAQAKRDQQLARIQTVIWESEYGFWLASNNDTWDTASPINAY